MKVVVFENMVLYNLILNRWKMFLNWKVLLILFKVFLRELRFEMVF